MHPPKQKHQLHYRTVKKHKRASLEPSLADISSLQLFRATRVPTQVIVLIEGGTRMITVRRLVSKCRENEDGIH